MFSLSSYVRGPRIPRFFFLPFLLWAHDHLEPLEAIRSPGNEEGEQAGMEDIWSHDFHFGRL